MSEKQSDDQKNAPCPFCSKAPTVRGINYVQCDDHTYALTEEEWNGRATPGVCPQGLLGCRPASVGSAVAPTRNEVIEACAKALEPANNPMLMAAVRTIRALKDAAPQGNNAGAVSIGADFKASHSVQESVGLPNNPAGAAPSATKALDVDLGGKAERTLNERGTHMPPGIQERIHRDTLTAGDRKYLFKLFCVLWPPNQGTAGGSMHSTDRGEHQK